ncbi:MAG: hypothetical protein CTY30_11845, partial [Methylocystis sp.]
MIAAARSGAWRARAMSLLIILGLVAAVAFWLVS